MKIPFLTAILILTACHTIARAAVDDPVGSQAFPFEYAPGQPKGADDDFLRINFPWADKFYGFIYYAIDPATGKGWHRLRATNGRALKGKTICTSTRFLGDGVSLTVEHKLGVNPRSDSDETKEFLQSPDFWKAVKTVDIIWGYCPGDGVLGKIVEATVESVKFIIDASPLGSDDKPSDQLLPPGNPFNLAGKDIFVVAAKVSCEWVSDSSGNKATGSVEPSVQSTMSCVAARQELDSSLAQSDLCAQMGEHWHKVNFEYTDTNTCPK